MIGHAKFINGLYYLQYPPTPHKDFVFPSLALNYIKTDIDLWHFRLGHPGNKTIEQICIRFPYIHFLNKIVCDICHYAKHHKLPFSHSSTTSTAVFDLIHVDIWGPMSIIYVHGHKYFLSIVDDLSRHTWAFMMHSKAETKALLQNFIAYVKNWYGKNIKVIKSDNRPEFNCTNFYNENGITHQRSCVETPQQNAVVERKH